MEAVLVVEGNEEGKCEEIGVEKNSSELSSPKQIVDPVVYKLVRVEGDGRLVPATDDEAMEVEDFLVDEQIELPAVINTGMVEHISNDSSSGKPEKESSDGLSASEGTEAPAKNAQFEELASLSSLSLDASHIHDSGTKGECVKHPDGSIESISSASAVCTSSKPDFYASNRVICLDNLSTGELHKLFRATFGRETTIMDKFWLRRRIAMGLTNSCDVSTTTFTIMNNKLVKKGKKNSLHNAHHKHTEGSDGGAENLGYEDSPASHSCQLENHQVVSVRRLRSLSEKDYGSEDHITDHRAAKRVRKPTKRYIEELSEVESRDHSPKVASTAKASGHEETCPTYFARPLRNVSSNERTIFTRLYSLGGSGVQVPYVSRVRRSRPRENIMALMNFNPNGMCVTDNLVKETLDVCTSLPESDCADKVLKARSASEQIKPLFSAEPEKDKRRSVIGTYEHGKKLRLKQTDSSDENSDDSVAAVPMVKGGMRRKHHRAWTLVEVMKLVEGVSKCGTGRWSEIKRLSFATFAYRTSVDLKDKWRNLLKASFAQTPPDDGSRKHVAVPIPASVLLKVRELAEMHSQVPPNLGAKKLATNVTRSVHHTRSGYL
ncbi:uncharacterized protein LOC126798304 isoform X2 [Argentina anserina]|uniref:uncharacterized protein LOC126798304 isoform X2 n=1 Tax=Argentina anserina TaxID=57926 RepID=UPI002176722F|nr:uncharacterized protein LOC126798304 isoform X2 [Potentilla anserina]